MGFWAKNSQGSVVAAAETSRGDGPFQCPICSGEVVFVAGALRTTKHFRHTGDSNCAWEPETPEHELGKITVRDTICELGLGIAEVEQWVGQMVADVLWIDGNRRIAFEVQSAPYEWARFQKKLDDYAAEGVAVVYLFIGSSFGGSLSEQGRRVREIERHLLVGTPEFTRFAKDYWPRRKPVTQAVRQMRVARGAVMAGYLRRAKHDLTTVIVKEPVWVNNWNSRGEFKTEHVLDAGAVVTPLGMYLRRLHRLFLVEDESVWLDGVAYRTKAEACWGHVFGSLQIPMRYQSDLDGGSFEATTGFSLVAKVGRWPVTDGLRHAVWLDLRPRLQGEFCFAGSLALSDGRQEIVDDVAVLGGWRGADGSCVPDIGQYNQAYAGAITGLHDGGVAGGLFHAEVAQRVEDAWLDAEAILSSGYAYPSSREVLVDGVPVIR